MAAATAYKSGIGCGTYRNTGTFGTPSFTLQSLVASVSPSMQWQISDAPSRASAVNLHGKSILDVTFGVMMRADDADTGWAAWVAAFYGRTTVLDLLILNGLIATEGAQGMRAEFLVTGMDEAQDLNGAVMTNFTLKPTFTSNGYPRSVIMGSGSTPSYSSISV